MSQILDRKYELSLDVIPNKKQENSTMIYGIIGSIIGLIGGIIGTYFSFKRTKNEQERNQLLKFSILLWGIIILCLGIFLLIPHPYKPISFLPCWILLPFIIKKMNKKHN